MSTPRFRSSIGEYLAVLNYKNPVIRASSVYGELEFINNDLMEICGALTQPESRIDEQHAIKLNLAVMPLAQSCKKPGEKSFRA